MLDHYEDDLKMLNWVKLANDFRRDLNVYLWNPPIADIDWQFKLTVNKVQGRVLLCSLLFMSKIMLTDTNLWLVRSKA